LTETVSLIVAFNAGLVSFLSPCFFPLIPVYISFLAGASLNELSQKDKSAYFKKTLVNITFFIIGFSLVFILLGASASFLGQLLQNYRSFLSQLAGAIIILFGLHLTGLVKVPFLEKTHRAQTKTSTVGIAEALLIGFAFALGWTPCVGPILGSILLYAAAKETVFQGMLLLTFYSLGLGLPLFLAGLAFESFLKFFAKTKSFARWTSLISGVFLIVFGLLLLTGQLKWVTSFLLKLLPWTVPN
jgi:cytochrome c-type biogenesis protein